jgi:trehalose 6-phosphate phosphatase
MIAAGPPQLPEPTTPEGRAGLAALLDDPGGALVACDFDGTLAPIVEDPAQARADPQAVRALARLARVVRAVAVVTGRPAAAAVELGGFHTAEGLGSLVVLGHYGLERWDAASGRVVAAPTTPAVRAVKEELPTLLAASDAPEGTWIEDKGSSVAVHTRPAADPHAALVLLREPVAELARRHGLRLEPGRLVLELRPPGVDKGDALTEFLKERKARSVMYAGDDLGDLAAFDAVRGSGLPGVTVCSGSAEVTALADRADMIVDGPDGVVALLRDLAAAL